MFYLFDLFDDEPYFMWPSARKKSYTCLEVYWSVYIFKKKERKRNFINIQHMDRRLVFDRLINISICKLLRYNENESFFFVTSRAWRATANKSHRRKWKKLWKKDFQFLNDFTSVENRYRMRADLNYLINISSVTTKKKSWSSFLSIAYIF